MSDFPYLDGLGAELIAAAARLTAERAVKPSPTAAGTAGPAELGSSAAAGGAARRRRGTTTGGRLRGVRRGPLGLFASGLALSGATAVALAATGILTGSPVRTSHPSPPRAGIGAPIVSSARLLPISFRDPSGGLPWGVRSFRTTRGMICLQIGRIYDGKVGALVDGRFRPFSLSLPSVPTPMATPPRPGPATIGGCRLPGETFSMEMSNVPASGIVMQRRREKRMPPPKAARVRWVAFGALGPTGRSATYEFRGHHHTVSVARGSGTFLVVLPVGRYSEPLAAGMIGGGVGGGEGLINPGSPKGPVRHFTYDIDGHTCLVSRRGTDTCRAWTKRSAPLPKTRRLHRPVHAAIGPVNAKGGSLLVSFKAPYAITSAASNYQVIAQAGCDSYGATVQRDVKRGEVLHVRVNYISDVHRCGPRTRVQVIYTPSVLRVERFFARGGVIVGETTIPTPR